MKQAAERKDSFSSKMHLLYNILLALTLKLHVPSCKRPYSKELLSVFGICEQSSILSSGTLSSPFCERLQPLSLSPSVIVQAEEHTSESSARRFSCEL